MNEKHFVGMTLTSKLIEQYTYPLLTKDERNKPVVIASCIFIVVSGESYLVTARHAITPINNVFFMSSNGKLVALIGQAKLSKSESKDKFDIAVVHVNSNIINSYGIKTIQRSMLASAVEVINPHSRAISGFLASKNKTIAAPDIEAGQNKANCFTYFAHPEFSGDYDLFGMSQYTHIGIELLRGTDNKNRCLSTPNWPPRGISGGGAWLIPDFEKPNEVFLEGIFIEAHRYSKRKFGFSTKIEYVVDFVRQTHKN
jgi:hypothetical protein